MALPAIFKHVGQVPYSAEALGLLGCVLKRLKILMKFDSAGPVGKNGAKFLAGPFSPNLKPLE